jgi:hypothetical protein
MKKKWWIGILASVLPLAIWGGETPDRYIPGEPRFVVLPPQRVLVVSVQGDPDEVAGAAYRKLYRTFYAHADKAERRHAGAPLARWAIAEMASPKSGWNGNYAIPVSNAFPEIAREGLRVETWEYGLTAETLHIGPYAAMSADIASLQGFIDRNGFAANGTYEEVYLKGPGLLIKGDPSRYRTLIRYSVQLARDPSTPIAGGPRNAPATQAGRKE